MMAGSKGKSNARSLFDVHRISSDNQIRALLDAVTPKHVFPVFEEIIQMLEHQGPLKGFRSVADTLLVSYAVEVMVPVSDRCLPKFSMSGLVQQNQH